MVSGPSGVGKGTLCRALREALPSVRYSVSATTRSPRPGEQHGVDYFFLSREEFEKKAQRGEFLEWAEVYGNYYGTPWEFVEETLARGEDLLLEIDMQGALQVRKKLPEGVFVFLLPPSWEEQKRRIQKRGTEPPQSLSARLEAARQELQHLPHYDYVIINDKISASLQKLLAIITAEKCRVERNRDLVAKLLENHGEGRD